MKNFILFAFFVFLSFGLYGQWTDACIAPTDPALNTFPTNVVCNNSTFADEGGYTATSFGAGAFVTGFYSFSVSQSGYYNIAFAASGGSPAGGELSVAFGSACPAAESDHDNISPGFMITSSCPYLTTGTSYYIATASLVGTQGEFTITISKGEDVCEGALPVVLGDNFLSNDCSQLPSLSEGTVWSAFTVVAPAPGQNDHIQVNLNIGTPPGTLANPAIISVLLNDCNAAPLTAPYKCLNVGDVLYIETGDNTPTIEFGDYTLNITETYLDVPNDDCANASNLGILSCTGTLNGTHNPDACGVETDCAGNSVEGVWYRFTTSASVYSFSFTGTEFRVYTGPDCLNLTSLGCAGDVSLTGVVDNPATTYWVMVYGSGSFTVQSDDPVPANNLCSDAILLSVGDNPGTNVCATAELSYCTMTTTDHHQVYYYYTNGSANYVDIDLSFSPINTVTGLASTGVRIHALSACPNTPYSGFTEVCDGFTNGAEISCLAPGATVYIVVGSIEGEEGDFNINLTVLPNPLANNDCSGAIDWGALASSCQIQNFSGLNNTGACPDTPPASGACDFTASNMNGVWYSFTTDADVEKADITTNLANGIFALYTGACGSLSYVNGSCSAGGSLIDFVLTPNTTYYLLISSTTEESNFSVDITLKNAPANNLCANAVPLTNGTPLDGTNACADGELTYCTLNAGTSHQVYYTYTNNTGNNVDLNLTINSSTATTGTAATNVSVGILTACPGTFHPVYGDLQCDAALPFTNQDIVCLEDGETLIFVIGSPDGSEGDFNINLVENPHNVPNDECVNATDIVGWTECEWFNVDGTNVDACPEDFDAGGCGYDQHPVVWLSFTPLNDGTVEFDNFTAFGDGFFGIFEPTADCDNQTALTACNLEGSDPYGPFNVTGGTTYNIAVGSNTAGGFSFDIKINKTLNHDDPCASGFTPLVLNGNYTDDNTCASQDFTICGGSINNTNGKTLFYEYTMTQNADLEISVAGNGAAGPFYLAVYESVACGNSTLIIEDCDADVTIPCLDAGETVIIMVATTNAAGAYGQYDITINESTPVRPSNDECADAEDINYDDTDLCKWVPVPANETTIDACSEEFTMAGCDFDVEEVVWYSLTTPPATVAGSNLNVRFSNYSGSGDLFVAAFTNNCTPPPTALGTCMVGLGPHVLGQVNPNTTYLIAVGSAGDDGGTYDMEVNISSGPPNDDACAVLFSLSAYELTGGSLPGQTNSCSVADVIFPECNADDQTNAVIYYFEIPNNGTTYGIHVSVLQEGSNPINPRIVAGISSVDTDFCTGTSYIPPAYCAATMAEAEFEFTCLEPGLYQLQISSSDANSGTFEIRSEFIDKPVSACNNNDYCADATSIDITTTCEWIDFSGCNTDACPDQIVVGACDLSEGPTVWYSVLIPTGAATLEVSLDGASFNAPVLAVFSECPVQTGWCNGTTTLDPIDVSTANGSTYYIAVSDGDGVGGTFDLHVKIDVPPINDSPCMASVYPPYNLGTSGSHTGTTCCAIGANDDNTLDQANVDCNGLTDDNAVWYRAEFAGGAYDGVEIYVTGGTIGANATVEVYVGGADAACDGTAEFKKSKCDGLPVNGMKIGCIEAGDYIFIKVASTDGDCGTFSVSIAPIEDCDVADDCADITSSQIMNPVTPVDVSINTTCLSGCLQLACPEPSIPGGSGCDFTVNPTVWFQVNTDAEAAQLYSYVTTSGTWTPVWSVYAGNCSSLTNAAGNGSFPCSSQSTPPTLLVTGVTDNTSYYIAVTADPNGPPIDDPNFEICVATIKNVVVCLGDDLGCAPDASVVWEITARENTDAEPNGPPYFGPFCPGEELHIELSYFYDATETGDDWLLGMIPKFSCGWDVANFDFAANAPTGNGQTADWYEETGPCPPQMMENVGHLCTYTDDDGHLRLVNTLCEVIPAGASCSGGLQKFDPLPSGYFWVREGGSPDCDPSNCSPSRKYGIGSPTASISWGFDIKVKEFADQPECLECNDLNIIFQTFSDGAAGCWDDPVGECLIDKPQWSPTWQINCDVPPGVVGIPDPQNICTGNEVGMTVATEDGSVNVIEITFEDNPNVTGESNHTFNSGTGTIDDILTLTDPDACAPELVIYYGQVIIPGMICEGKIDTFEVNVYPLPRIPDDDIPGVCLSSLPYTLTFNADCGYPGDYSYEWADDISGKTGTGNQILIDNTFGAGAHTFTISITDELGCENTNILEFEVYDDVVFYLQGDTLCWGEEKEFIPEFFGSDVSTDFTYDWYWQSGIGLNSTDPTLYISEQDYGNVYYPGPQQLCLIVYETHSDGVVCQADTCVDVIFSNFFNLHLDPDPAYICAGQGCVDIELVFDDENGIKYDDVADIAWNGSPGGNVIQEFCNVSYGNFVVITDNFGCDTIIYFDVEQNPITPLTITGDTIICKGDTTTLTISENFDSYQWSTGDINKIITVSPDTTTTYTVSAINNSGCVSSGDIRVEVFGAEVPDIPDTISFCTGYNVTYTAPAGYASYKWYYLSTATAPISVSPTVVIDKPGDYILVVTTSIGCSAQNTIKAIEDNELSPVVFGDFLLCYEQPTTEVWASGGTFTRLEWRYTDKNGILVPNTTDKDTVNLSDGKYYVWVSDGNCAGDTTFTIVRKPKIEPKIIPDKDTIELCYGQTTTLSAPDGFAQYQWNSGQFTQIISNVGKGKYIVTVTDADGCIGVDSIYVEVYPKLLPKLQDSVNICDNESVWLKPGIFHDYKWYKNNAPLTQYDGVDSIQVSENALFIVQVFNEIGCTAYDTIRVIKDAPVVPDILGIIDLCDNDLIVLTSSQDYAKYKWTNSDEKVLSTAKTCNFTMTLGKNTEQVTLLVENANACTGTVTKPVNRYNTPILRLSNVIPTVCGKNTTSGNTILDFSTYFITGSNSDGTWAELDASGATHNANWTQVNFSNVQYGKTYRFVFTTNTAHAPCTNISDTLYVGVVECICDSWDITALSDVCNDASSPEVNLNTHIVDQNGVRITPPPSGTWTVLNGTADLINGINFVPANAPSKTYTLQYKLTNIGNYCVDTATVTITVQNSVKPGNPLPFSICAGTDVLIRLDSMLVGESSGGVWTETSSVASTGNAFKASAGTFTTAGQLPGTYTFKYTLDAVDPCPDADATVTIIIDPVPSADAGPDQTVCFEDKPVKLSTSSVGEMYSWRLKGTTDILADTKEFDASQSGTYVLRVQTGKGCFKEDEVDVTIKDQIVVNISGTTILRNGETDTLFASYTGRNVGDKLTYNWTKDGVPIQQANSNYIIVSEGGNYCVDIEDEQNCLGSDCHVVGVELTKEINIPNIFSPDGDSKNDRFFVKDGKNVSHIRTIKVYDRWGELVWSDGDYAFANRFDHFWDGMLHGKKAMQGVYVYLVEFTWSDGEEDFVAGDVTLVR